MLYCGLIALAYCYLGFPLLLLISTVTGRRSQVCVLKDSHPTVALLVSVYNEEARIQAKIDNFCSLDYPREKLELWIGSDGSTDRMPEIVRATGDERINVVESSVRSGKTAVLNRLAERTKADILLFTDVNAMLRRNAVTELTQALDDSKVGLASGKTVASGMVEGAYYRYENWLKAMESRQDCLVGADGAIYAIRRSLYEALPPEIINDFAHPCHVIWRGFAARFVPAAVCDESASSTPGQEFRRQTRMASQAFYIYLRYIGRLVRAGKFRFAWVLTSHKLLRWFGLIWMLLVAIGAAGLAKENTWAILLLAAQAVFLLMAGMAAVFPRLANSRLTQIPLFFTVIHLAYLRGIFHCLSGERYVTWEPRAG